MACTLARARDFQPVSLLVPFRVGFDEPAMVRGGASSTLKRTVRLRMYVYAVQRLDDGASEVRRFKLDPGLIAPRFQRFNLIKRNFLST